MISVHLAVPRLHSYKEPRLSRVNLAKADLRCRATLSLLYLPAMPVHIFLPSHYTLIGVIVAHCNIVIRTRLQMCIAQCRLSATIQVPDDEGNGDDGVCWDIGLGFANKDQC